VAVGVALAVGVAVGVAVAVAVAVGVAVAVAVAVAVGVDVAVAVGVGVDVAVAVGVGVDVAVAVAVGVGVGEFTFWPPASEPVLLLKFASPLYWALTVWLPGVKVEVLDCAVPPTNVTGAPALLPSITNWTVPVGVPDPGAAAVTVAVKVTVCPFADGFCDDVTPVAVFALFTVWPPETDPLLLLKLLSPLYCATTV
jgi:hypothetical protein